MKAEHRKELQTNALADSVGRLIQNAKAGPSRNGLVVGGAIVLLVALVLGWFYYARTNRARLSELWLKVEESDRALVNAEDLTRVETAIKDLHKLSSDHPGTSASRVLKFQEARALLRMGLERLYSEHDRKAAIENLKQAAALYEELAPRSTDVSLLHQEALVMAGKAREALGELDTALARYRDAATRYPESALGKEASERQKFLEVVENRQSLERFHEELNKLAEGRKKPADPALPPVPSSPPVKP